ncbi:MAG: hypothetical protein ABSG91_11840 [Syntrophobacteraceae bacterium]|jgi:hypothetical protein
MKVPLLFLGDSHISYFRVAAQYGMFQPRPCRFCEVPGATALGLENPNSATNALVVFQQCLSEIDRPVIVVMQLGEVDCGFVIWYRSQKYAEDIADQMRESIKTYFAFVDSWLERGFTRFIITGAVLPTIRDGVDWGDVANKRREVSVPLLQRTQLTIQYNDELRKKALARGLPFVDITDDILDTQTGLLSDYFRNPNQADHHLHYKRAAKCWARRLNKVLSE